ncbi:hypothetical protein [Streptomyces achromogenes]|uniref:hypothetical protein n=1 Tax=Streptomyces achromogenes TaxID=67255 RepID=UPI0037233030
MAWLFQCRSSASFANSAPPACISRPADPDEIRDPGQQPARSRLRQDRSQLFAQRPVDGRVPAGESTSYPGTTEELLRPVLEEASGLQGGVDFLAGFSPERISPGNKR